MSAIKKALNLFLTKMPGANFTIEYHEDVVKKDIPLLSQSIKMRVKKMIEEKLAHRPEIFGKPLRYPVHRVSSWLPGCKFDCFKSSW